MRYFVVHCCFTKFFLIILQPISDFVDDVQASNITIISQQLFLYDPFSQVKTLKVGSLKIMSQYLHLVLWNITPVLAIFLFNNGIFTPSRKELHFKVILFTVSVSQHFERMLNQSIYKILLLPLYQTR